MNKKVVSPGQVTMSVTSITSLDPANAMIYLDILMRAMLKRKAEEIHRIKRRLIREEAEHKEMRRDFSSLDKLAAEVVEES